MRKTFVLLTSLAITGCQMGTGFVESVQGDDATQAQRALLLERFMASDCRTLRLQEQGIRKSVQNPLLNISGGMFYSQHHWAMVEAMKRKGCAA